MGLAPDMGNGCMLQAVVVTDPGLAADVLGKGQSKLEVEKSVDSVYSKFNIVGAWCTYVLHACTQGHTWLPSSANPQSPNL